MAREPKRGTPEELKKFLKDRKVKEENQEAFTRVKNGRTIIYVIAGIMALQCGYEYYQTPIIAVFIIYIPIVVSLILMGVYYFKNPYRMSITALIIYCVMMVFYVMADPSYIYKGLLIKGIIIYGLIKAIKYGKDYKAAVEREFDSDVLDQDMIKSNL